MTTFYVRRYRNWKTMDAFGILNWFTGITCTRMDTDFIDDAWRRGQTPVYETSEIHLVRNSDNSKLSMTIADMRSYLVRKHHKAQFADLYDVHDRI